MPAYDIHSLTLYCDNRNARLVPYVFDGVKNQHIPVAGEHMAGEFPTEFRHQDQKVCRQRAKQAGWKFHKDGRTLCPRCVQGGIKL